MNDKFELLRRRVAMKVHNREETVLVPVADLLDLLAERDFLLRVVQDQKETITDLARKVDIGLARSLRNEAVIQRMRQRAVTFSAPPPEP